MSEVFQTINVGTTPNDGTGDQLRTAFAKVNSNFSYESTYVDGSLNTLNSSIGNLRTYTDGSLNNKANSSSLSPTQINFSTSIPFSYSTGFLMQRTLINSSTNFSVNSSSAIPGTGGTVTLVADGSTTPTFSGFTLINGSDTYSTTLNANNSLSI